MTRKTLLHSARRNPLSFGLLLLGVVATIAGCNAGDGSSVSSSPPNESIEDREDGTPPHITGAPCESCEAAKLVNGKCDPHDRRFVAGLTVPNDDLYQLLDAHGHDVDPARFTCEVCRAAYTNDGYCDHCGFGFVGQQLYFSRLTFLLAQGTSTRRDTVECDHCRTHWGTGLWCPECQTGWVGNVAFTDRALYDRAGLAFVHLKRCVEDLDRCEWCAHARFSGMECPTCGTTYPRPTY